MQKFSIIYICHNRLAWGAVLASSLALSAHAVENSRVIQFNGQAVPASSPSASLSSASGSMTISPMLAGNGLSFPSTVSYSLNVPGYPDGTTISFTPATSAVPHRLEVGGQLECSPYLRTVTLT